MHHGMGLLTPADPSSHFANLVKIKTRANLGKSKRVVQKFKGMAEPGIEFGILWCEAQITLMPLL